MKYMDKQAFLEVKLAFLLDCIDMGGKEHAKCKKQRWAYADSKMQLWNLSKYPLLLIMYTTTTQNSEWKWSPREDAPAAWTD